MPYPVPYARDYGFQSYSDSHPGAPAPGNSYDTEYDAVALAVTDVINFLKMSMRSDGRLLNGSVGVDQLAADLKLGFKVPTTWAVSTSYAVADTVWYGSAFYTCITAHTSGSSFNPGYFSLIADFGAAAIAYTNAAAVSAAAASASATAASNSVSTVTANVNQRAAFSDTLANAKALYGALVTVPNGHAIIVGGNTLFTDGYGGTFVYKSGDASTTFTRDGLGFVDNQGRRFFRQYQGLINVQWFKTFANAALTGLSGTDDTSAFVAALATGHSIWVPYGNYLIASDLIVIGNFQQRLIGEGRYVSCLVCNSTTGKAVKMTGNWSSVEHIGIFFGSDASIARKSGQKALALESCDSSLVSDVMLMNGLVNLDIESCIDIGVYNVEAKNGQLACRFGAALTTYAHACNKIDLIRFISSGHTQQYMRVDQSSTDNISAITMINCRSEEDGTVGSGLYTIAMDKMVANGASFGAYIQGMHIEGVKGLGAIYFRGTANNTGRTLTVRDSTLITQAAMAYTVASLIDVDQAVVCIESNNALGAGATNTVVLGQYTQGRCLPNQNRFAAAISRHAASVVNFDPVEIRTVATLPAASSVGRGCIGYVTDDATIGETFCVSNGTVWKRPSTVATVS